MEVVYITIGVSVIIAIIFFSVFLMNLKKGQLDDTYTPSVRMLFDDEVKTTPKSDDKKEESTKNKSITKL